MLGGVPINFFLYTKGFLWRKALAADALWSDTRDPCLSFGLGVYYFGI